MFKLPNWDVDCFEDANDVKYVAPDWNVLLQLITVSANEFTAMTMGCNQGIVEDAFNARKGEIPFSSFTKKGGSIISKAFEKRLRVIVNHMAAGTFPKSVNPKTCYLLPSIQWAHNLGWELPEPLLKLLNEDATSNPRKNKDTPLNSSTQPKKWRKAFEYESDGLNALYDLIEHYYFDADGNPIYIPTEWPLKKNLESYWLSGRTLDEADTIITSGKRKGKAEK